MSYRETDIRDMRYQLITGMECVVSTMNYWEFGDYIGIGAGAHSKITKNHSMERRIVISNPISYVERIQSNNQFFKN